jgi:hypothetical protein
MKRASGRRLIVALAALAAGAACAGSAGAQLAGGAGGHAAFDGRERAIPVQFRDFFRPLWGGGGGGYYRNDSFDPYNPFTQRQQVYESLKPPPPAPRKPDAPPVTENVLVIGDSFAEWLAYGLEEAFADTPQVGIVRKIRPYSGLVRYEARPDAPDWSQAVKDVLAGEKPSAIVVMLGLNDRLPLRERAPAKSSSPSQSGTDAPAPDADQPPSAGGDAARKSAPPPPGGNYEFHTDKWGELYEKRVDEMIAALKSKGVPLLWVGLPSIRGAKSTTDMQYLDELYRARAEKAGIIYVDIWDGFVDEQGRYAQQGPDFQGQTRRLRTYDGVNFTKNGAEKLAHYVERELRRVLTSAIAPVALPGAEEQTPAKGGAAGGKPAIGPAVPLNALGAGEGGELLGAAAHAAQKEADPLVLRVLNRGEALAAPPGRADDFSWPRSDINPDGAAEAPAPPAPATPAAAAPKGAGKNDTNKTDAGKNDAGKNDAGKNDAGKNDAGKNDAKKPAAAAAPSASAPVVAPAAAAPPRPRPPRPELDGAPPRPPLPVGPAAAR